MPTDTTRTVLDVDAQSDKASMFEQNSVTSEEVLYANPPNLWAGITAMRARHYLKRLKVDLREHTLLSHVTDGADWQIYEGKNVYQGRTAKSSMELFSAERRYDIVFSGEEQEDLYVMIAPDFLQRLAQDAGKAAKVELSWQGSFHDPFLHHLLQSFDAEIRAGCPNGALMGDALGMALGTHLLNRYAVAPGLSPQSTSGLSAGDLRRIQAFVQEHLHTDLSVSDLAACVNLSPFHFSRLFRFAMRQSPYQYVLHERVARAKRLLLKGELSLSQIAQASGFASQSHLNRHFKTVVGVAPGTLRSQHLGRNEQKSRTNVEDQSLPK